MNTFQECKAVMEAKPKNRYRFDAKNHVHLLDGQPLVGTSTAMGVVAKPLTYWASGLAVQAFGCPDAKLLTKVKNGKATKEENDSLLTAALSWLDGWRNMTGEELVKQWDKAYRAHATTLKEKATVGMDLHWELERFVRDEMTGDRPKSVDEYLKQIWPFIEWSRANVKAFLWSEGHMWSETHWIGGISDAGAILNDDRVGIMDFKSSKEAYLTQHWQCGGYCIEAEENGVFDVDGNRLVNPVLKTIHEPPYRIIEERISFDFTAIVPFGAKEIVPHLNIDVEASKRNFLACLQIWNALPKQ